MLAATLPDVRRVLEEQFESKMSQAAVCVVSSREKLEEANRQRPGEALEIQNILP
jgi:Zn-dependent M16 (insulinase) family peptidase